MNDTLTVNGLKPRCHVAEDAKGFRCLERTVLFESVAQGFALDVFPLEDIMFVVQSPGRNLALAATSPQENKTIGLGDLAVPDTEILIINNESLSKVGIYVMNYDKKPANFALTAYVIQW